MLLIIARHDKRSDGSTTFWEIFLRDANENNQYRTASGATDALRVVRINHMLGGGRIGKREENGKVLSAFHRRGIVNAVLLFYRRCQDVCVVVVYTVCVIAAYIKLRHKGVATLHNRFVGGTSKKYNAALVNLIQQALTIK